MLCPEIEVDISIGLDITPEFDLPKLGLQLGPYVSFDVTASLSLTLGVPVLYAAVEMGVTVSIVALTLPFEIGLDVENSGLFGDISFDIKVLELTIFLKFKLCLGFGFFKICPLGMCLHYILVSTYS